VISWGALRLLASGAFDGLLRGLSAALNWLLDDWRNAPMTLFGAAFFFLVFVKIPRLQDDLAASEKLVEATQLAHLGTIANFIDASDEAQRQAEANAARVRAEQEVINDEVTRDLRSDLAAVSARFDRLRARNAAANPGRADPAGLPAAGNAAGRIAGAPGDHDLPAARSLSACPAHLVCLTIDQAERASQDAHRHNRLIDWALGQSAVRFAPEGSR